MELHQKIRCLFFFFLHYCLYDKILNLTLWGLFFFLPFLQDEQSRRLKCHSIIYSPALSHFLWGFKNCIVYISIALNTQLHGIHGVLVMHFNNSPTTDRSLSLRFYSSMPPGSWKLTIYGKDIRWERKSSVNAELLWPPSITASSPILVPSMAWIWSPTSTLESALHSSLYSLPVFLLAVVSAEKTH